MCGSRRSGLFPGGQRPDRHRLPRVVLRQIRRLRFHRRSRREARQGLEQRDRLEGAPARFLERFLRRHRRHQGPRHAAGARQPERAFGPAHFSLARRGGRSTPLPALQRRPIVAQARQIRRLRRLLALSRVQVLARSGGVGRGGLRGRSAGRARARQDPSTGEEITLRNGRFGEYIQQGEGEKPKRSSLPKGLSADDVTLEKALALLALAARSGAPSDERGGDPRRHRPLRRLCAARQDLRQPRPRRRRAGDRRQPGDRSHRRQGERRRRLALRRRRGARTRRAPGGRQGQREGRPVRLLRQSRQDQRHHRRRGPTRRASPSRRRSNCSKPRRRAAASSGAWSASTRMADRSPCATGATALMSIGARSTRRFRREPRRTPSPSPTLWS